MSDQKKQAHHPPRKEPKKAHKRFRRNNFSRFYTELGFFASGACMWAAFPKTSDGNKKAPGPGQGTGRTGRTDFWSTILQQKAHLKH